jgi:hypothetical protein
MDRAEGTAMSWKTGLARLLGQDVGDAIEQYGRPVDITPASGPIAYTPEEDAQDGKVPGTAGHELAAARELLERERAFAPHCDQRILHAPGDCWACDLYPDWQKLRQLWGIAFTGHQPKDEVLRVDQREEPVAVRRELPCPADYNRPPESPSDHRQWGPNTAQGEHP